MIRLGWRLFESRAVPSVGDLIRTAESARVGARAVDPPVDRTRPVPEGVGKPRQVEPHPPSPPWPPDPHQGVVRGPQLVDRTLRNRALVTGRYSDDLGFPVLDWGTFTAERLGWHYPEQENVA